MTGQSTTGIRLTRYVKTQSTTAPTQTTFSRNPMSIPLNTLLNATARINTNTVSISYTSLKIKGQTCLTARPFYYNFPPFRITSIIFNTMRMISSFFISVHILQAAWCSFFWQSMHSGRLYRASEYCSTFGVISFPQATQTAPASLSVPLSPLMAGWLFFRRLSL